MPDDKQCTKCGEIKSLSEFCKNKNSRDGLNCWCKVCACESAKAYYRRNADEIRPKKSLYQRGYYKEHREQVIAYNMKRMYANMERHLQHQRISRERNREKIKLANQAYTRAHLAEACKRCQVRRIRSRANGGGMNTVEWENMKAMCNYTCLCCGLTEPEIKLTPDHVIPVAMGGSGDASNIQPLCLRCNQKKHKQTTDYRK